MKRLHLHIAVDELSPAVAFYTTLFGAEPTVLKPDYAKWMLEDPRVNLAISTGGGAAGLDHAGIQVESANELAEIAQRLKTAGEATREQVQTTCCYAVSDKAWVNDPSGVKWETFHSTGTATVYGERERDREAAMTVRPSSSCCAA